MIIYKRQNIFCKYFISFEKLNTNLAQTSGKIASRSDWFAILGTRIMYDSAYIDYFRDEVGVDPGG